MAWSSALVPSSRTTLLFQRCNLVQVRSFKSELKIKWVRPEKIPCIDPKKSGDLKPLPTFDCKSLPKSFEKSEELNSASDLVKRMFTLEFLEDNVTRKEYINDVVNSVRRHHLDVGSMECRIAKMTARIRYLQDRMMKDPKNSKRKVVLKELIDKRKKFLKYLRRWDYKRFEWLLEKLDISYHPPPNHFHWITRKESLCKLTDKYCNDLKEERLKAYKQILNSQKQNFLEEKIKKLKWIMEEEAACRIESTVFQSDIDKVISQLNDLTLKRENVEM